MQLQLFRDIEYSIRDAHVKGVGRFSILNSDGSPSVRCNARFSASKGYLVTFSWLDGNEPTTADSLALAALFTGAVEKRLGKDAVAVKLLTSEYGGPPGRPKLWHHTYSFTKREAPQAAS